MSTPAAAGTAAAAPTVERPRASEFAAEEPRLRRLARMPAEHPERAELREQVILAFLPVGERIAARYSASWPGAREDLRQVASVGVINAVDRWNPDRASGDVLGYIVPSVRGEVLRYIRDRTWVLRVPRRLKELSVAVSRAVGILTHELGRAPRPSELARHLDVDVEEVLEALTAEANHHAATLDAPGADGARALADRISDSDRDMHTVDDVVTLGSLLRRLPERDRRIIELRFFHDRTQTQIATEIGISQMHVSRLLSRTLAGLRRAMVDDDPLRTADRCRTAMGS